MKTRKDGEPVEALDIGLGGGLGENPHFADWVEMRVAADEVPGYIENLLATFEAERADGQTFREFVAERDEEELQELAEAEGDRLRGSLHAQHEDDVGTPTSRTTTCSPRPRRPTVRVTPSRLRTADPTQLSLPTLVFTEATSVRVIPAASDAVDLHRRRRFAGSRPPGRTALRRSGQRTTFTQTRRGSRCTRGSRFPWRSRTPRRVNSRAGGRRSGTSSRIADTSSVI